MKTREQRMAQAVYTKVKLAQQNLDPTDVKKYGAMAHQLPVLIRISGLMQTLEFVRSRKKAPLTRLLSDLGEVLGQSDGEKFVAQVRHADLNSYMYLTNETLAALLWFKRYAQSVLNVDNSQAVDFAAGE